jgi:hypothetical protein
MKRGSAKKMLREMPVKLQGKRIKAQEFLLGKKDKGKSFPQVFHRERSSPAEQREAVENLWKTGKKMKKISRLSEEGGCGKLWKQKA